MGGTTITTTTTTSNNNNNSNSSNSNSTTASTENNLLPNGESLQEQNSGQSSPKSVNISSAAKRVKRQIVALDARSDHLHDDDLTGIIRKTRSDLHAVDAPRPSVADCGSDVDSRKQDFLERNRLAASKCRQKKKEHTQYLQLRHEELTMTQSKLKSLKQELEEELFSVQNTFLASSTCDCEPVKTYLHRLSQNIT